MESIIEDYLNSFPTNKPRVVNYDCPVGSVEFRNEGPKTIIVRSVFVSEEYRRRGIATAFIRSLITKSPVNVEIDPVVCPIILRIIKTLRVQNEYFRFINGRWTFEVRRLKN
jgi:predicted GNAT family acetyltransferase